MVGISWRVEIEFPILIHRELQQVEGGVEISNKSAVGLKETSDPQSKPGMLH